MDSYSARHVPWFFRAPEPYHFRLHPGTCGELCLDEEFVRSLPRTPVQFSRWLRVAGVTADVVPMATLIAKNYRRSPRYVLQHVAFPGNAHATFVMLDSQSWAVQLEHHGLPEFIRDRAVAYAVFRGETEPFARAQFTPANPAATADRRLPKWAIGIERETGLATIIDGSQRGSLTQFLMTGEAVGGPFEPIF